MRKCIESIIGQSFQNWELLLVDDGNDADYIAFAAEYTQKDGRIQVLHQEHSGVSFARNNGLKAAKGNYICFIDSDDFVDGTYLQRLYEAIQGCDLAICAVAEQFYPTFEGWVDKHIFWSRPTHYNGLQYINFCHNKLWISISTTAKASGASRNFYTTMFLTRLPPYIVSARNFGNGRKSL